jgi:hypothetical protein
MPKFTLSAEWEGDENTKVTHEFDREFLPDVIEQFQMFLRGCGYYFKGELQFVTEDE